MKIRYSTLAAAVFALAGAACSNAPPAESVRETANTAPENEPVANANRSIWTLDVTRFRRERGNVGGYDKRWDLSDLPVYAPTRQVSGTLRIWGSNYLKDGPLGQYWAESFARYQPGIQIEYNLPTTAIAVPALAAGVADLGVGRPATLMDYLTFEQVFRYSPGEVTAATGSYDVYGWSPAFIIMVHKDNPLNQISMQQLDGVFGTARQGGYDGSIWRNDYPWKRGIDENIRTWGQLGLTGEWADQPIMPCGQSPRANIQVVFQNLVLRGSDQWVEGYRAFANYATPEGRIHPWSTQVRNEIEHNPLALCIGSPLTMGPGVKELAVQGFDGGPYVQRTLETVRDRSYPLINSIFFYFNKPPGASTDPKVEEFLRFVLSRQGQEQVQREGRYLPLTGEVAHAQLAKLEAVVE